MAESAVIPPPPAGYSELPPPPEGYAEVPPPPSGYSEVSASAPSQSSEPSTSSADSTAKAPEDKYRGYLVSGQPILRDDPRGAITDPAELRGLKKYHESQIASEAAKGNPLAVLAQATSPAKLAEMSDVKTMDKAFNEVMADSNLSERLGTPLLTLPKPSGESRTAGVVTGLEHVAEGLTTPTNIALLATLGGAPAVIQKLASGYFAATMGKGAIEQGIAASEATTPKERFQLATEAVASAVLAGVAGKHAFGRAPLTAEQRLQVRDEVLQKYPASPSPSAERPSPAQPPESQPTPEPSVPSQESSGQAQPENNISALNDKINSLLQRKRLATDETEKSALWGQAMELEKQLAAEEAKAKPPEPPTPEAAMVEVASAEPPPVPKVSPALEPPPEPAKAATEPPPEPPVAEPVPAASQPSGEVFGIRNAITDKVAESMGLPKRETPGRITGDAQLAEAQDTLSADPNAGRTLVDALKDKPRPLTYKEDAILTFEQAARQMEYDAALEAVNKATDEATRAEANTRLSNARNAVQEIIEVDRSVGTENARGLEARKRMIRSDFTPARAEAEMQAARGKPFDTSKPEDVAELAKIKEQTDTIKTEQAKVDAAEAEAANAQAKEVFDNLLKEEGKTAQTEAKAGKSLLDVLKKGHDDAVKSLRSKMGRTSAGVDPTLLYDVARIGAYHIANGAVKIAEFTKRVVADAGDWVKDHIDEIFAASKGIHEANKAAFKQPKEKADPIALAKEDAAKGELSHKTAFEMVRSKIQEGVEGFDAVMEAAHKDLFAAMPGVTLRDVRAAFSEYGKTKFPSKDALAQKLSEYRRLGQLAEAIQDVLSGKPPKKSGAQRNKPTQDVRAMMAELRAAMDKAGIETQSPEQQLASRNQARATALRNQIDDLNKRIATGEKKVKGATTPDTQEVIDLRKQRDALKEEADRLYPEDDTARRLQSAKKAIANRQAEVERRIKERDFSKPAKRSPVEDKELLDAKAKIAKAKGTLEKMKFEHELKQRTLGKRAIDSITETVSTIREIKTSFDVSAPFRQGKFLSMSRPLTAARGLVPMLRAFFSEKYSDRAEQAIHARENATNGNYAKAKLALTDPNSVHLSRIEEDFRSRWAKKIPGVKGSGRAYASFLNRLRADTFDAMIKSWFPEGASVADMREIASFINAATGRGSFGKYEAGAVLLNKMYFSPKFLMSRFQLASGQPIWASKSPRISAMVAMEYGRAIMGFAAMYAMLAAMQDEKDPAIGLDPRKKDTFLTVRFGNTRVDPTAGLKSVMVLASQLATGKAISSAGEEQDLRDAKFAKSDAGDVLARFNRSKLNPATGTLWNLISGKDFIGRPVKALPSNFDEFLSGQGEAAQFLVPMSVPSVYQTMQDVGGAKGLALSILSLLGDSVNTYEDQQKKKKHVDTRIPVHPR